MTDRRKPVSYLRGLIPKLNVAAELEDEMLARLAENVVYGYDVDRQSRTDWEDITERGLKIVMQKMEAKTSPWPDCANIKHPLIAIAAIQFAARAYPEIVKGKDVVRATVIGEDKDGRKERRAKRVSQHMSWQLLEEMQEWDEDTDKLLHALPVLGIYYRKTFREPLLQRNKSEGRSPMSVVVHNDAKDLETCRRVTDEVWLYKNEVIERERSGLFCEGIHKYMQTAAQDDKAPELFLEQHCYADLDGDDYEEPYVITVHKDSSRVARIVARFESSGIITRDVAGGGKQVVRIEPVQYFTKYSFIPSPDGKYHDLGFAQLLGPLNETMNTILNQLVDAGTLNNLQAGFVGRGIRWQGGVMRFIPGEWKNVDVTGGVLKDNVVPLPTREPSNVLYLLLGWINDAAMRLASVSETMTGDTPKENTPATTVLAMIEQGLKVFTAIYKRIYRSLRKEYKKLFQLNGLYLNEEEYYRVLDVQESVFKADYNVTDLDVIPVADPTLSSEAQRLARIRVLWESMERNPSVAGRLEILKRYYEALEAPEIDKLLPPEEMKAIVSAPPPPNPDVMKVEAILLKQKAEMEMAAEKLKYEIQEILSKIELNKANAIKALADAEAAETGQQFEEYKHEVEQLREQVKLAIAAKEADTRAKTAAGDESDPGATGSVEKPAGDEGSPPVPPGGEGGLPGPVGEGPNLESQLSRPDGPADLQTVGNNLRSEFNAGPAES